MSQDKLKHILRWVTAALILITAACLIICCVSIYRSGDHPFSRETVAAYAGKIAIAGWVCLVAVAAGLLLIPGEQKKAKAIRADRDLVRHYQSKIAELTPQERAAASKEACHRRICRGITAALITVLFVYPVIYYADPAHFTVDNLNRDVIRAVAVALIPTALSLALAYGCTCLENRSLHRELEIYKSHPLKPDKIALSPAAAPKTLAAVRGIVLAAAALLIILGIANGGAADVLSKAIRICTECIGLG